MNMISSKNRIAIIGGGPSGIMAAAIASLKSFNEVFIFEKNEKLGKKLYITGKGRCNITNASPNEILMQNISENPKFMFSALNALNSDDLIKFLNRFGLKTKVERGNRVFPVTDRASDVTKTFEKILKDNLVNIRYESEVISINKSNNMFIIETEKEVLQFDKVLIATGGLSYPSTGSTGDGYKFAKNFGHKIIDTKAGLCAIKLKDDFSSCNLLSLKNVELSLYNKKRLIRKEFGELLFKDNAVSGPIVLTISNFIDTTKMNDIRLILDLKPALDFEILNDRILRELKKYDNSEIKTMMTSLLPKSLINIFLKRCKIDTKKKCNQISKEERHNIIDNLKSFNLHFDSLEDISSAIITRGGIDIREINPATMESKKCKNLYFAGEVLAISGLTGGFNLQIAFSTGYCAGMNL